jgi:transcriptional regulator of acetoin/glycerol metabolism
MANKGTLVLDEVSDLPIDSQAKLLRVLETKLVTPVGSTEAIPVDVRVIATTHRDLRAMATSGSFRGDLYAQLTGFQLVVPPLRHRKEDIQWLLRQVIGDTFTFRFLYGLVLYDWPFNVRELLSVVTAAKLAAGPNPLDYEHLPAVIRAHVEALQLAAPTAAVPVTTDVQVGVKKQPRPSEESLREVLVREKGNVAALARHFDRDRALIHRWLKDAGLNPDEFRQDA